jgi:gas vesicle protein
MSDFKNEMKDEMSDFKNGMKDEMSDFKNEIKVEIGSLKSEMRNRFFVFEHEYGRKIDAMYDIKNKYMIEE